MAVNNDDDECNKACTLKLNKSEKTYEVKINKTITILLTLLLWMRFILAEFPLFPHIFYPYYITFTECPTQFPRNKTGKMMSKFGTWLLQLFTEKHHRCMHLRESSLGVFFDTSTFRNNDFTEKRYHCNFLCNKSDKKKREELWTILRECRATKEFWSTCEAKCTRTMVDV